MISRAEHASLRRVFALFKPYRFISISIIFVALLSSLLSLAPPLFMKSIVDDAILGSNVELLLLLGVGILATLVSGLLDVLQNHLEHIIGQKIMYDLRINVYRNLLNQAMSFFTQSRSGEIIQRLTHDIHMVQSVVTKSVIAAITQSTIWIVSVIIILMIDYKLALAALLVLPLYILPSRKTAKIRKQVLRESQIIKSDLSSHIAETTGISGALLTRIYCREAYQAKRFSILSQQVMQLDLRLNLLGRWVSMFNGVLPAIGTILIYVYGGYNIMHGSMTLGGMIAFTIYLGRLFGPTQQLLNLHMDVMTSLALFERIFEYQDLKPEVISISTARALPSIRGEIIVKRLTFQYSLEKQALKNITFEVQPGELVAIVGPSGAGKSTLIGMLARLHDPTSGTIEIDKCNIRDVSIESLRRQIAFVTQESYLFHASIKDNILFAQLDATDEEIEDACRRAYIHDYIHSLPHGYETIVGERGYRLSGGERQRLSLARAIVKKPKLLILDEATSHLYSQSESYVQAALEELMKACTTIVIAHRLSTILRADKIIVLDQGVMVEIGTHQELLKRNGLYASLYQTQFHGVVL